MTDFFGALGWLIPLGILVLAFISGVRIVNEYQSGVVFRLGRFVGLKVIEAGGVKVVIDPKAVMCLLSAKDGRVIMGMANDGQVASMSSGFAAKAELTKAFLARKMREYEDLRVEIEGLYVR